MKKLFLLIVPILFFLACNNTDKVANEVKIFGTVQNADFDSVEIVVKDGFTTNITKYAMNVDGSFSAVLPAQKEAFYQIFFGNFPVKLYLAVGDSIQVSTDLNDFENATAFKGNSENVQKYLHEKNLALTAFSENVKDYFALEEAEFLKNYDSVKNVINSILTNYNTSENNFSENFVAAEKLSDEFFFSYWKLLYEDYFRYYNENEQYSVSSDFYDFVNNLNMNNSEFANNEQYITLLLEVLNYKLEQKVTEELEYDDMNMEKYRIIDEFITDTTVNYAVKSAVLMEQVRYLNTDNAVNEITDFLQKCNIPELTTDLRTLYEKKKAIAAGSIAPDFTCETIEGGTKSLSDFKGKYVYVDVWATWCAPCKEEIPAFEALKKEFKNKNIAFVSVSVDRNKEDWTAFVPANKLTGNQLWAERVDGVTKIGEAYFIESIPRFIIVDPQGKIVSSNARRPSSDGISEYLNSLEGI